MFRFAEPKYFYLLLVIPLMVGIYLYSVHRQKKQIAIFGRTDTVMGLLPKFSFTRAWVKFIILLVACVFVVLSLARPQVGSKLTEVKRKGIEIIIALDVSNSMLAEDIQPNRLERAKQSIAQLVDKLTNDRIGLIVFSGDAYVQLPVTSDFASAKMFLSSISPEMVSKQGTAIGRAIDLASNSFTPQGNTSKALIIISDGENHEDDPVESAKLAAEKGIVIHTIGIGSPSGAPIPVGANQNYLKDENGNIVVSRLDEETLSKIAIEGNGKYIRASNSQFGLLPLFENLSKMSKTEIKEKIYSEYSEQFQYFLAFALALLVIDSLILERKNPKLSRFKLVDTKNGGRQ